MPRRLLGAVVAVQVIAPARVRAEVSALPVVSWKKNKYATQRYFNRTWVYLRESKFVKKKVKSSKIPKKNNAAFCICIAFRLFFFLPNLLASPNWKSSPPTKIQQGNNDATHEAGSSKLMPTIGYGTCCRPGARGEDSDSDSKSQGRKDSTFCFY